MNNNSDHFYHQQTKKKQFDDIVKYLQPRTYQDEDFLYEFKFRIDEIHTIKKTYEKYAYKQDLMDKRRFCNSLGILAMDNAHFLADRLFDLMDTDRDGIVRFIDFIRYLDAITNRDLFKKAEMSFKFIDRDNKEMIVYEDIEYLIHKVALFWKDLTGQIVVPQREHIDEIFRALDSRNTGEVRLSDFQKMYYNQDCYFQWFEFFNQDQTIQTQVTNIENDELLKQKDQLLRMEIENKLRNVEQEVNDLIVTLNKVSTKYKELKEIDEKQRYLMYQMQLQKIQSQKLQDQKDKNDSLQKGQMNVLPTQMNANLKNSLILNQKDKNGQNSVDEERLRQNNTKISQPKKYNNQNFELVLHPTYNLSSSNLSSQNQKKDEKAIQSHGNQKIRYSTSQENIKQMMNRNQGENPPEFASSSSTSSITKPIKKNSLKQIMETIAQSNNNRLYPSIDFSTMSTLNTNQIGQKQQSSSSQKRPSIFYNQESTQKNKTKQNIFQQNDFLSEIKKNQNAQISQNDNSKSLNQIPIRNNKTQFDQSAYYGFNNFIDNKTEQRKNQEKMNKSSNNFMCGGFEDIFHKQQFETQTPNQEEQKKQKRRYRIFDSSPVHSTIPQAENLKNQEQKINSQENMQQHLKYKTFSTPTSNVNITKNQQQQQQQQQQQDTNKLSQQNSMHQDFQSNRSPLYMQVIGKNTNNLQNSSPLASISKGKYSSLSLHFGSISEISCVSGEAFLQPPILNNVSGPVKINLPTEQNFGDNDPETEDETDFNNNRSYLEQKFQLLQNQSSQNTNSSIKKNKQTYDTNASPSSMKSGKTDVLYYNQKNKKQNIQENNTENQNASEKRSLLVNKNKFKIDEEQEIDNKQKLLVRKYTRNESLESYEEEDDVDSDSMRQDKGLSQGKAVDYLCQEYQKIEKKIQEYVDQISYYQQQLKELDEQYINQRKKSESKLPYKKNGVLDIKQLIPTIIDEESFSPAHTSNQLLGNVSQRRVSLNQFNLQSNSNQIVKKSQPYNSNYNSNDNNMNHRHTFSPVQNNLQGSIGLPGNLTGSGHNIVNKRSMGYNEYSSDNLLSSNRKSTIQNIPNFSHKDIKSSSNKSRNLQLYIGHENWNLILEMMLVIRSAIKSLKKINHPALNHGYLGTGICVSINTENNQQNNNQYQQNYHQINNQNSIFYQNQNNFQNNQNYNHNQNQQQYNQNFSHQQNNQYQQTLQYMDSSFVNLDNQLNNQTGSIILPDKRTLNKLPTGVYDGNNGLPIEIRIKDFEQHNQQLLFNSFTNSNYHFASCEYIDFCPLVFESLRRFQNISQETFLRSLGPENLIGNLIMGRMDQISELCRSSTEPYKKFQYYSECGQFIIKTIPEVNAQYFLKILPNYYQFILNQPNTLILRIYGLYKLQIRQDKAKKRNSENQQEIERGLDLSGTINNKESYAANQLQKMNSVYFIVCQNVFNKNVEIKHRFEIKGSTRGRKAVKKNTPQPNQTIPKKDLDWIDSHMRIRIDSQLRQQILNQLSIDSQFLSGNRLLNYCALIGVKDFQRQQDLLSYLNQDTHHSTPTNKKGGATDQPNKSLNAESKFSKIVSQDKKSIYFLGLINIFTEYTTSKKWIAMIKNPFLGKTQSTVDPQTYATRLVEFFDQFILD